MTLTEFNQRRSFALRCADTQDVLITRGGAPVYRLSAISSSPGTLAAEIEAGRVATPRRPIIDTAERRIWRDAPNLVQAALVERAADR